MSNTQQARSAAEPVSAVPGAYEVDGVPVGSIRILDGAITTIVKRTVLGIEGVARLSGSSLIDDFADLVRSKRMQERSIQIEHDGDGITVSVAVNPYFGYKFPALIDEIKTKVTQAVSDMAGIQVSAVRVDIRGIEELPAEEPAEEPTQDKE
ncbi:MAG: Asp23/Gls24 family envelope stress response protein [Lentisphaeria bacterium]|nr:Asp23/Gls24 family envelope stress response protein [Lentisphaeria bacterium]